VESTTAAVPPGELCPAERDHYRVFTPYWRRWRTEPLGAVLEAPQRLAFPRGIEPGDLEAPIGRARTAGFPGGETAGRRRLERWLSDGLSGYADARDDLGTVATSGLSAYLHFGCVSAREVAARAREREAVAAEAFVRQLCWRDFYGQLLAANPRIATEDLYDRGVEWNDDEEAFGRWRDAQTGEPVVDAAMRQLHSEGWLPNRARLIVAAYLTKTLRVHWRRGAEVFSELLVDADVANNVGNWQWVAGTGVDTRFNRRFSLVAQAKRFDPDGAYVRRFASELGGKAARAART
jgi:deoxyribodipyrimidine photo-lyase